jgi:hypothetical protein
MFMRPESLVVELVGEFHGNTMPYCGFHGPLAANYGVHHYIHYWDWKLTKDMRGLDFGKVVREAREFWDKIKSKEKG